MRNYNFVKYEGNYPRGDTKIGINKSGLIRLSSGFCRNTNVTKFKNVILFYDSSSKAIAFKFTNNAESGILKVTKDRTGATISGKAFMITNKIKLNNYVGRYDWKKEVVSSIGEVYIIELDKE